MFAEGSLSVLVATLNALREVRSGLLENIVVHTGPGGREAIRIDPNEYRLLIIDVAERFVAAAVLLNWTA